MGMKEVIDLIQGVTIPVPQILSLVQTIQGQVCNPRPIQLEGLVRTILQVLTVGNQALLGTNRDQLIVITLLHPIIVCQTVNLVLITLEPLANHSIQILE